jgi:hypothetical protein
MRFPSVAVKIFHSEGKVPFIRMMPRSNFDVGPDPVYTKVSKNASQRAFFASMIWTS